MINEKKVRIGIAGCGWIARKAHIPALRKIDNAVLSAVFDINCEQAASAAREYDIPNIYQSFKELVQSDIDAVIICTPNYLHGKHSIMALEYGKHVLCEKPVALSLEEIKNVISVAERNKRLFIPGQVNRFRYDIQKINEIISSGEIGQVASIKAGWLRRSGIPRPGTWFTCKEYSGGGVLVDLGSHIIDICLMFMGDREYCQTELFTVRSNGRSSASSALWFKSEEKSVLPINVEEEAEARISFEGNARIDLKLSWCSQIKGDITYFKILGNKGSIKLITLFGFSDDRLYKTDLLRLKSESGTETEIYLDKSTNSTKNAFEEMEEYFISRVCGNFSGFLTQDDGLRTVALIEELYNNEITCDKAIVIKR
ncbi:MAG: Gfo/Idh/MocA family protein [Caulobacteraceae bacterium]